MMVMVTVMMTTTTTTMMMTMLLQSLMVSVVGGEDQDGFPHRLLQGRPRHDGQLRHQHRHIDDNEDHHDRGG